MNGNDERITPQHLSRSACVYIRQSTSAQVRTRTESARVQLGLRDKAIEWGWPKPTIVDGDLGVSAGGYSERPGFQQLLMTITMRDVGIVLCLDASRLSRNSKDWANLFELCGYFNTLIADLDQVYDLSRPNDRLLIGIKGTMSEMETGLLRVRMRAGKEAKAARGALRIPVPPGYVYDHAGDIVKDPDQRVQAAIDLLFEQFDRSSSIRQLAMWYRATKTRFPVRRRLQGDHTSWEILPSGAYVGELLVNPCYTGAYVHGRSSTSVEYVEGKLVKRSTPRVRAEDARVFLPDHHSPYISWERHLEIRARIAENRPQKNMQENRGAIREGFALLSGILRCAQCGGRIRVAYRKRQALYYCDGGGEKGTRRCLSFGSRTIDGKISEEVCRALEPLSIQAAVVAVGKEEKRRSQEIANGELAVQASQYEVDRAFEQFDLVDPKNRLVAATLEERLNEKLVGLDEAKDRLEKISETTRLLSTEDRKQLNDLASRFKEVWEHNHADPKLKKRILREVIHEVVVGSKPEGKHLEITIHWQGGAHTQCVVPKRMVKKSGKRTDPELIILTRKLAETESDESIARVLNLQGATTPSGLNWTRDRVMELRRRERIHGPRPSPSGTVMSQREACTYLGVNSPALKKLERWGHISSGRVTEFAPWRIPRRQLDSEIVQVLVKTLKEKGRFPKGGLNQFQPSLFDEIPGG